MKTPEYKNFKWNKQSLFYQGKEVASVVPDEKYILDDMWRVKWPDGVLSQDCYNLTRAKDNAIKYEVRRLEDGRK